MKRKAVVRTALSGAVLGLGLCGVMASPAFGAAQTGSVAGLPIDIGQAPTGLPASCPFPNDDANFVFLSGNGVQHESVNKNGDWGGMTAEGTAIFFENNGKTNTPLYEGHLTLWGGGGNNSQLQNEGGQTLDFHGTGPGGSLSIHANFHTTVNAKGSMTSNVLNVNISCSA